MPKTHGSFGIGTTGIGRQGLAGLMLLALTGLAAGQPNQRGPLTTGALPASSLEVSRSGDSRPPIGWVQFCANPAYAAECKVDVSEPETVELTPKLWRIVTAINTRINREIEPVTDMDQWGTIERWDMAESGRGDCEEYVNVKRKRLVEAGIPRRALRVVVVIDEENAGHAVLMLRTDRGDYILDNKRNAILPWHQTGYIYVKRESQDRVGWVALGGVAGSQLAQR